MDEYTGHVEPDGALAERVDGPLLVRKFSVEEMDNNVIVLACRRTGRALIVDAAARPERILEATADLDVAAVVQTHGHWDHVRAWDALRAADLPIWGHRGDRDLFPGPCDRWLEDGDLLEIGDVHVRVLHTPGHTEGALQYLVNASERTHLVSGDSLFPGGPGNTWGDAEKFTRLMDALETRIFGELPDDTWVYPGHGDDTTLGAERPHVPQWRERGW